MKKNDIQVLKKNEIQVLADSIKDGRFAETMDWRMGQKIGMTLGRKCGTCTACCVIPPIPSTGKPTGRPCSRLNKDQTRCSRYKDRYRICKGFFCGWLAGYGEEEDRPDKSGIIIMELEPTISDVLTKETGFSVPILGARIAGTAIPEIEELEELPSKIGRVIQWFSNRGIAIGIHAGDPGNGSKKAFRFPAKKECRK